MLFEKYRPFSFDDMIGQDDIVSKLKEKATQKDIPHLMFLGPAGVGKTTAAYCLARLRYGESWRNSFLEFNASDERGIDFIREKIKRHASHRGEKIIFLDECDPLTNEAQDALRWITENCGETIFIFSANNEYKIIEPLLSRCAIYRFRKIAREKMASRLIKIMDSEGVKFEPKDQLEKDAFREGFMALVDYADGDLRKAINTLDGIVGNKKMLTAAEVSMFRESILATKALQVAISGNFGDAQKLIEDSYIMKGNDASRIVSDLSVSLKTIEMDDQVRARLYVKLAETDRAIKSGSTPIVQLVGFISYAWIAPHLRREEVVPVS